MKLLIDISHPAAFHCFRSIIETYQAQGHEVQIIARDRKVIIELLNAYGFDYVNRGAGSSSFAGKLIYMLKADYIIYKHARRFKPDLFLSFSSPYAAQVAWVMKKPHISLNDTEHTDKQHKIFTYPFSKVIVTPKNYKNNLGKKHKYINSIFELMYLHPENYTVDDSILSYLNLKQGQPYVFLRFVAWNAFHDKNQNGFSLPMKRKLISLLKQKYKVIISSEGPVEHEFQSYVLDIPVHRIHDVLANADLYIGESATMASESAMLGTFAVYVNSLPLMSYLRLEQNQGLLKHFSSEKEVLPFVNELLSENNLKTQAKKNSHNLIKSLDNPFPIITHIIS